MLLVSILLMFIFVIFLVQAYTAFLTFKTKNITFRQSWFYFALPIYSLFIHLFMAYKLFKKHNFKKGFKMIGFSFTKYNIFLNFLSGIILEEIIVLETYGQSDLISKKDTDKEVSKSEREKTILEKLLKRPFITADQVAPIYS